MNQSMNDSLMAAFNEGEIQVAIKEIGSLKAPRYDGFSTIFY